MSGDRSNCGVTDMILESMSYDTDNVDVNCDCHCLMSSVRQAQ